MQPPSDIDFRDPAVLNRVQDLLEVERAIEAAHVVSPYHRFRRPRPGDAVILPLGQAARIVMVDLTGRVYALDDKGAKHSAFQEECRIDPSRPRLTLFELLDCITKLARKLPEPFALSTLAVHFDGGNGKRFENVAAHLWIIRAMLQAHMFGPGTELVAQWVDESIDAYADDFPDLLPPLSTPADLEHWSLDILMFDKPGYLGELETARASLERALEVGAQSILDTADDSTELAAPWCRGSLCLDLDTGAEAVIVGTTVATTEPNFLTIVLLDTGEAHTRHVTRLEIDPETIDEAWFWEVIFDAARRNDPLILLWLATLPPPEVDALAGQHRAMVQVVAAAILTRYAPDTLATIGKKADRAMRATFKLVAKEHRSRIWAVIPELAGGSRPTKGGRDSNELARLFDRLLLEALDQLPEADLILPPDAAYQQLEHFKQLGEPVSEVAVLEEPGPPVAELLPVEASPPALAPAPIVVPVPPAARERESAAKGRKGLSITDHPVLTSEWPLVAGARAYQAAVETALAWLGEKLGMTLPASWSHGRHEIERHGSRVELEAAEALFAFRLEHPDSSEPARWWRIEASILAGTAEQGGMVGVSLSARDYVDLPAPKLSAPALIRRWAESPGLLVDGRTSNAPLSVTDPASLDELLRAIACRERGSTLIVLPRGAPGNVAGRLLGLAQFAHVDDSAAPDYARRLKPLAATTAHAFLPGELAPRCAPVDTREGQELLWRLAFEARRRDQIPSFRDIADAIRDANARPKVDTSAEAEAAADAAAQAEARAAAASREAQDMGELLDIALSERDDKDAELQAALAELARLKARLHAPTAVAELRAAQPPEQPVTPASLAELEQWAASLSPRLVITEKALKHAASVQHNDVPKIYAALRALAGLYWSMRWARDASSRRDWMEFLKTQRLRCGNVGTAIDNARFADEYRFAHDGRTGTATMHVQGNSSHDPLRCLRIYFYPDDERQQIIVSHLPTHLTSTHT